MLAASAAAGDDAGCGGLRRKDEVKGNETREGRVAFLACTSHPHTIPTAFVQYRTGLYRTVLYGIGEGPGSIPFVSAFARCLTD